jgi:4'-phosphopantetheinyl transferase EntD
MIAPRVLARRAHGVVVALPIPAHLDKTALSAELHEEERALSAPWGELRARTFAAGRIALRMALREAGVELGGPILKTTRGAPSLPDGVLASVSHKDELAIAIASVDDGTGSCVGVDVELFEETPGKRADVSRHVLTKREREEIASLGDDARRHALLVRFSLKESLYKALDPFVQRYVGFLEVEVRPGDDGSASFALALSGGEGPFVADGLWASVIDPMPCVISSVRVRRG